DQVIELNSKRVIVFVSPRTGDFSEYNIERIYERLKGDFQPSGKQRDSWLSKRSLLTFSPDALNCLLFIELFPSFLHLPFPNEEATFVFKLLLEMTFEKAFAI